MRELPFYVCSLFLVIAISNNAWAGKELAPDTIPGTHKVGAEDVIDLVEKFPNLVIIDARKSSDHEKGYIEGSVPLPDTDTDESTLAKHIPDKSTPILFYCNGERCGRSVKSSEKALSYGYKNIYWFRGGWEEWTEKGFPVTK